MRRGAGHALLVLVLCAGCFGGGAAPEAVEPAPQLSDQEITAFSQRIEGFYSTLEDVPLDALVTYENKKLRDCFVTQGGFSDYFSALATEARNLSFRDSTARSVRIREFHFDAPDQASVFVTFTSVNQREIRFWSIHFDRHDTWKLTDGVWLIVPEKL